MKLPILASLLLVSVLLASCTEVPPCRPRPGYLTGSVELRNQDGRWHSPNDVSVSIEGTNYTTTSDENGNWSFTDIPGGTYTIVFRKEGFSWVKRLVEYVEDDDHLVFDENILCEIPTYRFLDLSTSMDGGAVRLNGTISEATSDRTWQEALVFYSTDPASFSKHGTKLLGKMLSGPLSRMTGFVPVSELADRGVASGTIVYVKAYPANPVESTVENKELGDIEFTNCQDEGSPVASFVMP